MKKMKSIWLCSLFVLGIQMTVFSQTNTTLGTDANLNADPDAQNTAIGFQALMGSTGANFERNTAVGSNASQSLSTETSRHNVSLGYRAFQHATIGSSNVAVGAGSLGGTLGIDGGLPVFNSTGSGNVAVGALALGINTTGGNNIGIGFRAFENKETGSFNIAIGHRSANLLIGGENNIVIGRSFNLNNPTQTFSTSNNIAIGNGNFNQISPLNSSSFMNNIAIGNSSGTQLIDGSNNVFLGTVNLPNSSSFNSRVIIADGAGNQRIYINSNGNTGIGLGSNILPSNRLEINSTATGVVANTMGLRFRGISNTNFTPTSTSTRRVLSVNQVGDVILVDDIGGGVNQNCSTANFIPVNSSTAGQLNCSQIFDNGTSVGVGTGSQVATYFNYTFAFGDDAIGSVPLSGTAKLRVNGVTWSGGFYATSDKKFKSEVKPIVSSLETIQKIDGKTYLWNKEANKEMNFDDGLHSGFIAQELEKVLPHLVATDGEGNKAVNYTELIPYLVEAIKEQQVQINDLKAQLTENFKTQNQDLIKLNNTKIISVSPNPSNDFITVSFNVEKSVQNAKLNVHDLNGNVIISLNINDRDNNINRTLQRDNFGKGIYIVSLVVNGKSIDTKKIVFN